MAHSDFLRHSWRAGILLLGFYLSKKVNNYEVYVHNNGIVVIHEDNGDEVVILPGMIADIDVLSGKRTILDYFWEPISRTKERAFKE